MKGFIFLTAAIGCTATAAFAQTEGRVSIGASVTVNNTTDDDVGSATTFGPVIRLNPHKGWGPAGALNWFRADLQNPSGGDAPFARLRTRPLMAGVSYTIGSNRVLTGLSIVAGPSFNHADFEDEFSRSAAGIGANIDAENSFAVRPGVGVTWTVTPRAAIVGFAGYLINRLDVAYRDNLGRELSDRWKADAIVLSVGAVYSIF